ncbi:beta-N-acetylhexosaminidase [Leeia sp.]|uniref:beta-N-acetylhexosaminidase n=1 Tax=Leeia sp. TaxID=2884678 RepID=UPI0035AF6593
MTYPLRAGEHMMIEIWGHELDPVTEDLIRRNGIRAVCLFRKNIDSFAQTQALVQKLRDIMGEHALIAIDQEGGAAVRAWFLPLGPSAMCLGAADDEQLAERVGEATAHGLAALGINWNFAPVLDLNNNPRNPIVGERSFGADPVRATQLALAWQRGSLRGGVACALKHFPGHGDTDVDSHLALPIVDKPRAALEQYELAPFALALPESPSLMTAHIVYPAFDAERPATLAPSILTGLLREEWGYQGVVISDALNMKAIRDVYGQPAGAVMSLQAGADMVLVMADAAETQATVDAVQTAIEQGALDAAALRTSRQRLQEMAARFPSQPHAYTPSQDARDRAVMLQGWLRGLTLHGNAQRPHPGQKIRLLVAREVPGDGVSEAGIRGQELIEALTPHFPLDVVQYEHISDLNWQQLPQDGLFTVLASTGRERYSASQQHWQPDLHLVLWNPYQANDIDAPALISYGFHPEALQACISWLKGDCEAPGRMPAPLAAAA